MVRGKLALAIKVIVLALLSALLLLLAQSALAQQEYLIAGFLYLAILLALFTYLTKKSIPLKFFLPGILLLFAFVLSPILFTVTMSGFNYKTGNIISKEEAILQIKNRAFEPDAAGTSFDIKLGTYSQKPALLVSDISTKSYFENMFRV